MLAYKEMAEECLDGNNLKQRRHMKNVKKHLDTLKISIIFDMPLWSPSSCDIVTVFKISDIW